MHPASEPSIEDLRRRSELARAELSATVRELRSSFDHTTTDLQTLLSPAHVTAEVKSYARKAGDDFYHRVENKIRENPLRAAAVGAGVAYPVLSILRRVPIPMMLIGAGFWLAGQSGRKSRSAPSSANGADSVLQKAGEMVSDAPSIVSDLGTQLQNTLDRAVASASEKLDQLETAASERISSASERITQSANTASAAAQHTQKRASDAFYRSQQSAADFVERNPMLVAGLGAGLGAVLAGLIPATRTEARVMGPARERVREEALAAAAKGVGTVRSAADAKLQSISENLNQEGLGPDGLGQAAARLTERAQKVLERGLEAALGDTASERQPTGASGEEK